jgi:hypothetical protein
VGPREKFAISRASLSPFSAELPFCRGINAYGLGIGLWNFFSIEWHERERRVTRGADEVRDFKTLTSNALRVG